METTIRKYALITGASSGIGYELTKLFARDGYNLILVGRSKERLDEIARDWTNKYGVEVTVIEKNLFDGNAAQEIYTEITGKGIQIEVLVNDAGQGTYGFFTETALQSELNIIQLNIISLVTLTKLFLRDMVVRKEGRILNLASMVSKMPSPLMAIYAATKAFVYSFSESLVNELQDTGVTVTALLPGPTATDFFRKAGAENTVTYQDTELSDPTDVAADGYTALMSGEARVISGMKNKFQAAMSNLIPDSMLTENMRKQMNEKSDEDEKSDIDSHEKDIEKNAGAENQDQHAARPIATIQVMATTATNAEIKIEPKAAGNNENNNEQTQNHEEAAFVIPDQMTDDGKDSTLHS